MNLGDLEDLNEESILEILLMNLGTILRDLEIVNLKVLVLYSLLVASLGLLL